MKRKISDRSLEVFIDSISLDGQWNLYYYPEHEKKISDPAELKKSGLIPIAAMVPGNVELDLYKQGIEKDPFFGTNIYDYHKYE